MLLSEAETNRNSAHIWRIRDRKNPAAGVERLIPTAGSVKERTFYCIANGAGEQ